MTDHRPRTMLERQWNRRRFWMEHGDKFRVALIGTGMIVLVSLVAGTILR
jgi:hypothetical protein